MDDETRSRLTAIEHTLSSRERRLDDFRNRFKDLRRQIRHQRWTLYVLSMVLGAIFTGLAFFAGLNQLSQRQELREFEDGIKADLLKTAGDTTLVLYTPSGTPLNDHDVIVSVIQNPPKPSDWDATHDDDYFSWHLNIPLIIKNEGTSSVGQLMLKLYTNKPFDFSDNLSADESGYTYEGYVSHITALADSPMPAGLSMATTFQIGVSDFPPKGRYKMLFKLYYGAKTKMVPASFYIIVNQNSPKLLRPTHATGNLQQK